MYIRDRTGNLVNLDGKDICISIDQDGYNWRTMDGETKYDAAVIAHSTVGAFSDNDAPVQYTLHLGTVAECRDFITMLSQKIGTVLHIECSSTPQTKQDKPAMTSSLTF